MWIAFEVIINVFQGVIIQKFMANRLHISRKHKMFDVLCVMAVALYCSASLWMLIPLPDIVVFIIPFVYALVVSDDKWYISAFWTVVLAVLFLSIISLLLHIFSSIPNHSYDALMGTTGSRIVFVLTTNAILAITVYLASKMKKDYSSPYWSVLLLFLLTNIALFVVEESLYSLQVMVAFTVNASGSPFLWAYIGLCACTILVVLLFHMMSESVERENRYRAEASAVAQSKQYQQELEQMYNNLRTTKHDLKQHYQVLEEMVRIGNSDKAKDYLNAYLKESESDDFFLTGSTAVDALLMAKSLTMKKEGITFKYALYPLEQLPISEPDFCTIIGNLIDNAIEGNLRIEDSSIPKIIQLTFSRSWEMFYIYCSNPCNDLTIRTDNGKWYSSKEGNGVPMLHAIGIRSIENIVRAAEGRSSFEVKDEVFNAKIVLPYSECEAVIV